MPLRFEGKVKHFREALKRFRAEANNAGTLAHDHVNRRRLQRILHHATVTSIRNQILSGGDLA